MKIFRLEFRILAIMGQRLSDLTFNFLRSKTPLTNYRRATFIVSLIFKIPSNCANLLVQFNEVRCAVIPFNSTLSIIRSGKSSHNERVSNYNNCITSPYACCRKTCTIDIFAQDMLIRNICFTCRKLKSTLQFSSFYRALREISISNSKCFLCLCRWKRKL